MPSTRVTLDGQVVDERHFAARVDPTPDVPYPNARMLGQADIEAVLRARLAEFGVTVELSTALVDFTAGDRGVTALLDGPAGREQVRVDYLVGADGGRSTVRTVLGIPFEGSTDDSLRMLLGDVRADALDHDHAHHR
ncbi:FAD-dependent monooxygenase [Nocardia panacis]|uniref:FAD-dependent monooxygenase n=1 Tax=Nocardia panacis TaxID=2340916 RepID=UPI001EF07C52|nr:FAD-dependent monooxygenase [Nocardia panacis]